MGSPRRHVPWKLIRHVHLTSVGASGGGWLTLSSSALSNSLGSDAVKQRTFADDWWRACVVYVRWIDRTFVSAVLAQRDRMSEPGISHREDLHVSALCVDVIS